MDHAITELEIRRKEATRDLDRAHRSNFGQFFTPEPVSRFMASLLTPVESGNVSILDPGAGIGLLSAAALARLGDRATATAYEIEPAFQAELARTLRGFAGDHAVRCQDFIHHAVELVGTRRSPGYDVAILNPPYKKIQTGSAHRTLVRKLGVETSNLYTCFLVCAIRLCRPGAQVVAIVPRSFMNGLYFKPFRYWLFDHVALTHLHIFESRDRAFIDDEVLQENVVLRTLVGGEQGDVTVSASFDQTFADISRRTVPFSLIVTPDDEEKFIHVPSVGAADTVGLPGETLRELGLDVCTGPVVDFRLRDYLRQQPEEGSAPLLYASHFAHGAFAWPRPSRKPNAIMVDPCTRRWLMRNGCYVVLRRFTSKEERRRVVAFLLPADALPGDWIGFENHLNVIHQDRHGLDPDVASGICCYLNSQPVDDYFRTFSGHTQVNATDLRRLRYPAIEELKAMGRQCIEKSTKHAAS
ncbi:MAG: Eco57I restriction-modification methylase domain-containing protein [Panacagrimonas sp.]